MPVEVKICGITMLDDARQAVAAGADYIGCILYPRSVRAVTLETVRRIAEGVCGARIVGVFVNVGPDVILTAVQQAGLHAVQVHGDEAPDGYEGLPVPLWRAVAAGPDGVTPDPSQWPAAERLVVDAPAPGRYGGTGERADWNQASQLAGRYRMMLAGGLNPDNVADAVRTVRPYGVDTASGVERAPGHKDHAAVERFIKEAKAV